MTQDFIAITEHKYSRWEAFKSHLELAEKSFRETYSPAYYSRLGLRYRNVIDRKRIGAGGVHWDELLKPYFVGLLGADAVKHSVRENRSISHIALNGPFHGTVILQQGLANVAAGSDPVYFVDADFHSEGTYTNEQAFTILTDFNRLSGNLFRWAITDRLEQLLQPVPLV